MNPLVILCAGLSLISVLSSALAAVAVQRSLKWQRRCKELLNKPFSFWQQRERHRAMMEAMRDGLSLTEFAKTLPLPVDDDKVVKFRRPPPFE